MTKQTIVVTYSTDSESADSYWIRIEQEEIENSATVTDTAEVLDALFQIDACSPEQAETVTEPVAQESAAEAVAAVVSIPACDMDPDGSVNVTILVYRSHLSEPYVLRLRGGEAAETVQVTGQVVVNMEISETVTLPYPVVSDFSCSPAPIRRNGNTLHFASTQEGMNLSATYWSSWDRVTVRVAGVDGEVGECRAMAFHHGIVDALDLDTPSISELDRNLCPEAFWEFTPTDYDVTCYKIIEVTQRCTCSRAEVGSYTTEQTVPCPNPDMRCPNNETSCMHLLGTETLDEWVECDGDSEVPGRPGEVYALSTSEYYEDHCCKLPSVSLPQCPTKRTVYKTELPIEHGQEHWRGIYGRATRFMPVPPPAGICGEWIIEQQLPTDACCAGATLEWDPGFDNAEVISRGNSGYVRFIGVVGPYMAELEGTGFTFANGYQTVAIDGGAGTYSLRIDADSSTSCGTATVHIDDECGNRISWDIRSPVGAWVAISQGPHGLDPCPITGTCDDLANGVIFGRYKMVQLYASGSSSYAYRSPLSAAISACNSMYDYKLSQQLGYCEADTTPPTQCDKCITGPGYTPCSVYPDYGGSFDPDEGNNCGELAYAYISSDTSGGAVFAYSASCIYSYLYEWRCS